MSLVKGLLKKIGDHFLSNIIGLVFSAIQFSAGWVFINHQVKYFHDLPGGLQFIVIFLLVPSIVLPFVIVDSYRKKNKINNIRSDMSKQLEEKDNVIEKLQAEIDMQNKFVLGVCTLYFKEHHTSDDDPYHPYCCNCKKPMSRGYYSLVCVVCGYKQDLRVLINSGCNRLLNSKILKSPEPAMPRVEPVKLDMLE